MMEHGQLSEALTLLTEFVAAKPNSLDAWNLLRQIHTRQNNTKDYLEATVKTCALHLKAHEVEAAFQDYAEFVDAGGGKMPAATWLELCKGAEEMQEFDRAFTEYQQPRAVLSDRTAGADRATQRRPPLPEKTEPPSGRARSLSGRRSVSHPASRLGAAHSVGNQRSKGNANARKRSRSRSKVSTPSPSRAEPDRSRGAATDRSPRRKPWVGTANRQAPKGRKKIKPKKKGPANPPDLRLPIQKLLHIHLRMVGRS